MQIFSPPKPHLTLVLGITGHRYNRLNAENDNKIIEQLSQICQLIDKTCLQHYQMHRSLYQTSENPDNPSCTIRLLTALAEGADQLIINTQTKSHCQANWQLEAILPFPEKRYEEDFKSPYTGDKTDRRANYRKALEKVAPNILAIPEIDANNPDLNYAASAVFMLRQIDVLLAVWDGKSAISQVGTSAVVQTALKGSIPVMWILPAADNKMRLLQDEGDWYKRESISVVNPSSTEIKNAIIASLKIEDANENSNSTRNKRKNLSAHKRLQRFLEETQYRGRSPILYDIVKRIANWHPPQFVIPQKSSEDYKELWTPFLRQLRANIKNNNSSKSHIQRIEEILLPRFEWADKLALHFENVYRSAYFRCYMLSVLAVFIALAGIFLSGIKPQPQYLLAKAIFVAVELILITWIISIVHRGNRHGWYDRWIEYRTLAESLRYLRFLAPLGSYSAYDRLQEANASDHTSWVLWYVRATIRELGMPNGELDSTRQEITLQATLDKEIEKQIRYNKTNAHELNKLDHFLHLSGTACFYITLAILALFLMLYIISVIPILNEIFTNIFATKIQISSILYNVKDWIVLLAAGLPALGAALAGIRFTGDFENFAKRSKQTASDLQLLQSEYTMAVRHLHHDVVDQHTLERTHELLLKTARVMADDLGALQHLFSAKRFQFPR